MKIESTSTSGGEKEELLSIGEIAQGCGISIDTIRVWEKRYGKPKAIRLSSGHRRYSTNDLSWLRRVAEAIALGVRPGKAVRASGPELETMLRGYSKEPATANDSLLDLVKAYRAGPIRRLLLKEYRELGPERFLFEFLEPALVTVGREWARGKLYVRHEHFLSETIEDFLRARRSSLRGKCRGPLILLTTLEGERHGIGLQIASLLLALGGARTRILGLETPVEEIARAVKELRAHGVAVSVSVANGGVATDTLLASLRDRLPAKVRLLAGGRGARGIRRGPQGIDYADNAAELREWLKSAKRLDQLAKNREQ